MGIIVHAHSESEVDALTTLMGMSENFNKRNWNSLRIGTREFVVDFANENALEYVLFWRNWSFKNGMPYFHIERWKGEQQLKIYDMDRYKESTLACLGQRGIHKTADIGQLLEIDPQTINTMEKTTVTHRMPAQGTNTKARRSNTGNIYTHAIQSL